MKAGRVVHIRVSPKDCMGCIDVLQKNGIIVRGTSFPQVVSMALKSLLNTVRGVGVIPDRDGFEYNEMMEPFADPNNRERKLDITNQLEFLGDKLVVPPIALRVEEESSPAVTRLENKIKEVYALQQADPENDRTQELLELDKQLKQQLAKERGNAS